MYEGIVIFIIGLISGGFIIWIINLFMKNSFNDHLEKMDQQQQIANAKQKGEEGLMTQSIKSVKDELSKITSTTIELNSNLKNSNNLTNKLGSETQKIAAVLSNPTHRGQWGEKMVIDTLNLLGLKENISFKKQVQIGLSRSDYAFYLPDGKSLHMDVKFPMKHYNEYLDAVSESNEYAISLEKEIKELHGIIEYEQKLTEEGSI